MQIKRSRDANDRETEYFMSFAKWEITDMTKFCDEQDELPTEQQLPIYAVISNILDQIDDQDNDGGE